MSQKVPVNNFEWIKDTSQFNEDFIKYYNDIQYLEKLHELHNDLLLSPESMKIEKVQKLIANLHDKTEYVIHIRNFRQALNHGLVLKKNHRVIKFNQNAYLEPYIDMNANLRKKQKMILKKIFLSL